MPKFKLISGKHHLNGVVYKSGDIVEMAYLSSGLSDRFELVDKKALRRRKAVKEGPYKAIHRGAGKYIVSAPDGESVHDGYLNKKDADRVTKEFNLEDAANSDKANPDAE